VLVATKNIHKICGPKYSRKMIIHWKEAEIKNFNPHAPPGISPSRTIQNNMTNAARMHQTATPPSPFHPSQLLNGTHTQTPLLTVTNGPAQNRLYNPNIMGREGQYQQNIATYNPFLPPPNLQGNPHKKNPFGNRRRHQNCRENIKKKSTKAP
jgi:hypothetical protein